MCSRFLRLVVPRFQSGVFRHWWCQLVGHRGLSLSEPSVSPRLLSSPFPISAARQVIVVPWPRRTALWSSSPTAKGRRTCLIHFCLCIPRLYGVSVAVGDFLGDADAARRSGLSSTCMRSCPLDANTGRDRGSFPCLSHAGRCLHT